MNYVLRTHRFLVAHTFYPLLLGSVLACSFWRVRVAIADTGAYKFLIWNLILAWLPYAFSLAAAWLHRRNRARWWRLVIVGAFWLLFFPNAPYIVTDLVHLWGIPPVAWWYDIGLIATFAWTGCLLAVVSLHTMQTIVRQYLGTAWSWLFALASLGLSGLGVYLGRFARLNSWDVFFAPWHVFDHLAEALLHPLSQPRAVGVSSMFAALLLVCYLTFANRATTVVEP